MKCQICGNGPRNGHAIFRTNPVGEIGKWACEEHFKNFDTRPIDPFVKSIVDTIQKAQEK